MRIFYRGNTLDEDVGKNGCVRVKVYKDRDWKWLQVELRRTDLEYLARHHKGFELSAPVLERRHGGWSLRFVASDKAKAPKFLKDKDVTRCVGVDLGVNTDATCVCVERDGAVAGQKFIDSPVEKDRLSTLLKTIRKNQRKHGARGQHRLWRYVDNYNTAISIATARGIVEYARAMSAPVIVFERLDFKGRRPQCVHLWRKREIQRRTEAMAARYGIRVTYVCAWNTSRLAFDGSGPVKRGSEAGLPSYSLCRFQTGKVYNCDLSAAKNIAARYFVRVRIRSAPATEQTLLPLKGLGPKGPSQAKVPEASIRTSCTLSALISLDAAVKALALAS